ncbi:MAG TPA: TIGR02996 domain-containing protein, partial [Gemmata sp.]|nr:TIGR02996 domain-containing protein [Gemmata sp.]
MTDRDALYRAIVAKPEDDTPRLVYADWLEENGREEEAEFIRLECRLETSCPDQPEYTELLDRQEELRLWLQAHSPGPQLKMGSGLNALGGRNWWQLTSRGFPRFLFWEPVMEDDRPNVKRMRRLATALEKAFAIVPTRWLVINWIAVPELAELLKQPVIAALDRLTIQLRADEQAVDEAARIIADCRHLRNLRGASLAFPVGEAGADSLGRSEHLGRMEWLSLDTANLTPAAVRSLCTGGWFHRLRNLELEDALSTDAFEELCRLPPCPNLHTLNLADNSFPVSSWQEFARSKTFPQLTRLELNGTDMSDGRMAVLAGAKGFRLTMLNLGSCAIGNEGVRALVTAPWIGSLRWLDLSSNGLGRSAVTVI